MSDREKDSVADLRKVEEFAKQRKAYAWRQVRRYGRLDDALPWFAGVAAGVAGITAAIEAPAAVTASVACARARAGKANKTKTMKSAKHHVGSNLFFIRVLLN